MRNLSKDQIGRIFIRLNKKWSIPDIPEDTVKENASSDLWNRITEFLKSLSPAALILGGIIIAGIITVVIISIIKRRKSVSSGEQPIFTFTKKNYRINLREIKQLLKTGDYSGAVILMFEEFVSYLEHNRIIPGIRYLSNREIRLSFKKNINEQQKKQQLLSGIFTPISRELEKVVYGHRPPDSSALLDIAAKMEEL